MMVSDRLGFRYRIELLIKLPPDSLQKVFGDFTLGGGSDDVFH